MGRAGGDEVSFMNIADVRPVRQPWSRWVAHQSSSLDSAFPVDTSGVEVSSDASAGK